MNASGPTDEHDRRKWKQEAAMIAGEKVPQIESLGTVADRPPWWPPNPYPKDIFPMTEDQYVKAIPDPAMRTAISGFLMGRGWLVADWDIFRRMVAMEAEKK